MAVKNRRSLVISALLFTLYILAFLLTESAVNDGTVRFASIDISMVYATGLLCTAGGYLLFYVSRKLAASLKARKLLPIFVSTVFAISVLLFLTAQNAVLFLMFSFLALLSFGYIGGMVHYNMSMILQDGRYTGRIIGISIASAAFIQFVIQNLFVGDIVFVLSVIVSVIIIVYFSVHPPKDWFFENPLPYGKIQTKGELIILMIVVLLMSIIMSVNDGIITTLHAQGKVDVLSWPRLFYAASVCAAGFIADIRGRKHMPLATVCALLISVLAFSFLQSPETYALNVCMLYLYSGFYVLFFTVVFLDAAPKTEKPELWAGMGRIVRSVTTGVLTIPSVYLFDHVSQTVFLILNAVLTIAVLLLLFFSGNLTSRQENAGMITFDERLEAFSDEHALTPREKEILAAVSSNEKTLGTLAADIGISERVFQRHLSNIYEKTGTQTRYGLAMALHGIRLGNSGTSQSSAD